MGRTTIKLNSTTRELLSNIKKIYGYKSYDKMLNDFIEDKKKTKRKE